MRDEQGRFVKGDISNKGRIHTAQTRENMRLAHLGQGLGQKRKPLTEETREKIRNARIGKPSSFKGRSHSQEAKEKIRLAKLGNKFRWIEDRNALKRDRIQAYDAQYKDWMLSVKNRDGWKCRIANSDCSGRLEAHHILAWRSHPELRYQINNGITLCRFHHPTRREDELKLSPYFQNLVEGKRSILKVTLTNDDGSTVDFVPANAVAPVDTEVKVEHADGTEEVFVPEAAPEM